MPRRSLIGWAAAAAILLGALLIASLGPPVELMSPGPRTTAPPALAPPPVVTSPPEPVTSTTGTALHVRTPPLALELAFQVVVVLVIAVVVAVLIALLSAAWRRPRLVTRAAANFEVPEVPDELLDTAADRISLLEDGEPRNAIVAAWLNLETSAAATGLPRDPAETSTEYTTRVLRTWDVDPRSLGDLAALYREARFSRHPLGEEHRRRAVRDLTTVHDDLRQVVARPGDASTIGGPAHPEGEAP